MYTDGEFDYQSNTYILELSLAISRTHNTVGEFN